MDEVITALIAQLEADLGTSYTYIYGRAKRPAQNMLPMIMVYPLQTKRKYMGTGGAKQTDFLVEVKALLNLKDYLDLNHNDAAIQHIQAIVQTMEQRNTSDATPRSTTILGSLEHFTDTNPIVDQMPDVTIMYTEDAQQIAGSYYVPVTIRVTFTQLLPRQSTL